MQKRFAYYERLSSAEKATYRKSDAIAEVVVPDVGALVKLIDELESALASGKRLATARASTAFVGALTAQLGVPEVTVNANGGERARRPIPDVPPHLDPRPRQLDLFAASRG